MLPSARLGRAQMQGCPAGWGGTQKEHNVACRRKWLPWGMHPQGECPQGVLLWIEHRRAGNWIRARGVNDNIHECVSSDFLQLNDIWPLLPIELDRQILCIRGSNTLLDRDTKTNGSQYNHQKWFSNHLLDATTAMLTHAHGMILIQ